MDPEANLREQRRLGADMNKIRDNCTDDGQLTVQQRVDLEHDAYRLAGRVEALDRGIASGGWPPPAGEAPPGGDPPAGHPGDTPDQWPRENTAEPAGAAPTRQTTE